MNQSRNTEHSAQGAAEETPRNGGNGAPAADNLITLEPPRYKPIIAQHIDSAPELQSLSEEMRFNMKVVSSVLPFRTNRYVLENLVDWDKVPEDPIYQLSFPQTGMLAEEDFDLVADLLKRDAPKRELDTAIHEIRAGLNPHPAGQQTLNVPTLDDEHLEGMQHKYHETVLFFPGQGQTCHAYCTFCFRWAQFVGDKELRFISTDGDILREYLAKHPEVTDVLFTGGDPMIMKTKALESYLLPIAEDPRLEHIRDVRIGTKALTFWPYRFTTDPDADDALRLFEKVIKAGKHIAIMSHFNHWRELDTPIVREAIRRIRDTGAVIRTQAPLLRHINDDADVWARMWKEQVRLGLIPYYMFVERDTGAKRYFELPLTHAHAIYRKAIAQVSGLGRTARGPVMSSAPGKVQVLGVEEIRGERVIALHFLQARNPEWMGRLFFAECDESATWLTGLKPAFGEDSFFFEEDFEAMKKRLAS